MEDAADDDHGVSPHDIHHLFAAELPEMIGTNNGVFVTKPHIIYARFKLNDIVDVGLILRRPVHTATDAAQRISLIRVAAGQLLKCCNHAIAIEAAVRKVNFATDTKLQLPALLCGCRIDPRLRQALQMVLPLIRIHHVNRFVATLEAIFNEREQSPIFFVRAIEESANMTRLVELGASKRNGSRNLFHDLFPWKKSSGAPLQQECSNLP